MKRVLTILETGGTNPQDKVRGPIYKPLFSANGIDAHYIGRRLPKPKILTDSSSHLINHIQSALIIRGIYKIMDTVGTRINHFRIAQNARHFDAIHLIKVSSLKLIKKIKANSKARVVYDLADGLWLPAYKKLYPDIDEILKTVDAVTCDHNYGLDFARQFNESLFLYPTPSQVEMFDKFRNLKRPYPRKKRLVIGWIGSPSTVFHLYSIWEALERIFEKHANIHLRLVGVGEDWRILPPFEHVSFSTQPYYSSKQMVREVLNMDIGLFPLFDIQDSILRGVLKGTIYMSGEAAVIASPRGQVPELINDGVNGLLAHSTNDWIDKLDILITNHALRQKLASGGLKTVRENFTLEKCFEKLRIALEV